MRSALVIVTCLVAAACSATDPEPRVRASGFAVPAGVVDPYEDGKRHLAAGRYQLATERFGQALTHDRRSLDALNGLAIAYARLGRFAIAHTYFERALQIDPTDALTLNNYGWSLVEQGRLRDAQPFLDAALRRAAEGDVAAVAANIESMEQAGPPPLVAALEKGGPPAAAAGNRFVRLAGNVYRLETEAGGDGTPEPGTIVEDAPAAPPALRQQPAALVRAQEAADASEAGSEPSALAAGVGLAGAAPAAPPAQSPATGPHLDRPLRNQLDAALRPSQPVPAAVAAAIPPGDRR